MTRAVASGGTATGGRDAGGGGLRAKLGEDWRATVRHTLEKLGPHPRQEHLHRLAARRAHLVRVRVKVRARGRGGGGVRVEVRARGRGRGRAEGGGES